MFRLERGCADGGSSIPVREFQEESRRIRGVVVPSSRLWPPCALLVPGSRLGGPRVLSRVLAAGCAAPCALPGPGQVQGHLAGHHQVLRLLLFLQRESLRTS